MKHREFIAVDFAGLSEEEFAEGSTLLGGSAAERVIVPRVESISPTSIEQVNISESEWQVPSTFINAVIRVGDREGHTILAELDRLRVGTGSETVMPYVTTFVMGKILVEGCESPKLSASTILEIESQSLEERRTEAQEWVREHGPAPEMSDMPPEEIGLTDVPMSEDAWSYIQQKQLESMQPMRALVLPWDESAAEELYVRNNYGDLGERRLCFFTVGKRVYTVGIGLHLGIQPE